MINFREIIVLVLVDWQRNIPLERKAASCEPYLY
jgi:hypothetical protein